MFDQNEQEISEIIETSLAQIQAGTATLEEVLAQHPGQAETIRPELEAALWLTARREEVGPRSGFVAASHQRVIARIQAEARSQGTKRAYFGFAWPQGFSIRWAAVLTALVILLSGTGSAIRLSQTALPGDQLYSVKRISEDVVYTVTLSHVNRAELSAQFADRRLQEARLLINQGDYKVAGSSLVDYEQEIRRTMTLLKEASSSQSNDVEELAGDLKQNLAQNAQQLAIIASQVPANVQVSGQIKSAVSVSKDGSSLATTLYNTLQENKTNPGAAPTSTVTPKPEPTLPHSTATPPPLQKATLPGAGPTVVYPTPVPPQPPAVPTQPILNTVPPAASPTLAPTSTPLPTAAPTLFSTSTPQPTPTLTTIPTAAATETAAPLPTATDGPTIIPSDTAVPLPTATDVPLIVPSDTPVPPSTATDGSTIVPDSTQAPQPTATDAPATAPSDTAVPQPTETSAPVFIPSDTAVPLPTAADAPVAVPSDTPAPTSTPLNIQPGPTQSTLRHTDR